MPMVPRTMPPPDLQIYLRTRATLMFDLPVVVTQRTLTAICACEILLKLIRQFVRNLIENARTIVCRYNNTQHCGNISDPPPDSSQSYRATSSAPMADGLSVWLVCRSGIPCRTACGIRLLAGTVSDNLWRHFCLQRTDAFSALQVSRWCGILIDFLLTYLLYHRDSSVNSHLPPDQHLKCVQVEVRGLKVKPILPVYKQLINWWQPEKKDET